MTRQRIIGTGNLSGPALIAGAVTALAFAVGGTFEAVDPLWHHQLEVAFGPVQISNSLTRWIGDGLMTVFFLAAGTDIKREMVDREACGRGGITLPALAALGVMVGATAVFAVAGAVDVVALAVAGAIVAGMVALRGFGLQWTPIYVLAGAALWLAVFESGVHATVAGVVCGLLLPIAPRRFHSMAAFLVVPVFALAGIGIDIAGQSLIGAITSSVGLIVVLAVNAAVSSDRTVEVARSDELVADTAPIRLDDVDVTTPDVVIAPTSVPAELSALDLVDDTVSGR